jgi:hypothetical protein
MVAASAVCSLTRATVRVHVGIAYMLLASAMPIINRIGKPGRPVQRSPEGQP